MGVRSRVLNWPVSRQLTGAAPLGRGASAASKESREFRARTATAGRAVKSVRPYRAVGRGQDVQLGGVGKGHFPMGENPAAGSARTRLQRPGTAEPGRLAVRDFSLIGSATRWRDGPEAESGERGPDLPRLVAGYRARAGITERTGTEAPS